MLSSARGTHYLHEPFNPDHDPAIFPVRFPYWFMYISEANEAEYTGPICDLLRCRYRPIKGALGRPGEVTPGRRIRLYARSIRDRARGARPLMKDPIALFSAEWLAKRFGVAPVVMIRHPAAFAGSLKVKQWSHPFGDFSAQPGLMRDLLSEFEDEIEEFAAEEKDIVDQAGLLWRIIHQTILGYRERQPDWLFVRHEDLSMDPLGGFEAMFSHLGLNFDARSRAAIEAHSFPEAADRSGMAKIKRNSLTNLWSWRARLTEEEVERLQEQVNHLSREFYSDSEWILPQAQRPS